MFLSICFIRFVFLLFLGCFCGVYFIISDLVYFIDWNIITLNCRSVIMTFLFDWMSLLFMGFAFIISSLVILYSDNYMFFLFEYYSIYFIGFDICCFYKSEGRSFVRSQLVSWEFFIDIKSFRSHYGTGIDSDSNRNEYQEHFLGVKAAGGYG